MTSSKNGATSELSSAPARDPLQRSEGTAPPRPRGDTSRAIVAASWLLLGLLLCPLLEPTRVAAAGVPVGFSELRLASGLDPTALAIAPDGRLFLSEKSGRLRIVKNGALLPTPFATVTTETTNEQGLLGVALSPDFASNGHVFVFYTVPGANRHNRISRFTAQGDVASGGETILLELSTRISGVHNGGSLAFGPDGKLYASTGDDTVGNQAQVTDTSHGKILRINADGSIPGDNPYPSLPPPRGAIWALGIRNAFQLAFQPGTGLLFINDVGANTWEEINQGVANANFGWPAIEGPRGGQLAPPGYRDPVHAYAHNVGCAITAGAFYAPPTAQFPASYVGKYLFADYCGGFIKTLDAQSGAVGSFATNINRPLAIAVAADGSLYYIARGGLSGGSVEANTSSSNGELYRVRYTQNPAPFISVQPESQVASPGETATFIVGVSGATPLTYQWRRNGVAIAGANAQSYTTPALTLSDHGARFDAVISNGFGSVVTQAASLTVGSNQGPMPTIDLPAAGALYSAGETLSFSGRAFDGEDGALPASRLSWWIDFHHATHTHPALDQLDGVASGTFAVPRNVETASDVFYRIYLRATDSSGRSGTTYRDVQPRRSTFTLATQPSGLPLLLDGSSVTAPVSITGVVGVTRMIEAPQTATIAGAPYVFRSWSDGGSRLHTFHTAPSNSTLLATYDPGTTNAGDGLRGEYFANKTLSGAPALTRLEAVDFNWGAGSPDAASIPVNLFSARWTGEVMAPVSGSYVFSTVSDDGVRLSVDGQLLINNWTNHASTINDAPAVTLTAGRRYQIMLAYYDNGGNAEMRLRWSYPGIGSSAIPLARLFPTLPGQQAGEGLRGHYFNNKLLTGSPVLTRVEAIDFGWGASSPATGTVNANSFSVRWSGELIVPVSGSYVFSTVSDDGIRVSLGGQRIIDAWTNHASRVDTARPVSLVAGQRVPLVVEYYDSSFSAEARLRWSYPGVATTAVPASALAPAPP